MLARFSKKSITISRLIGKNSYSIQTNCNYILHNLTIIPKMSILVNKKTLL